MTCKATVYPLGAFGSGHSCPNKKWQDGYCKIHHPERRKERQRKRYKDYRIKEFCSRTLYIRSCFKKVKEFIAKQGWEETERLVHDLGTFRWGENWDENLWENELTEEEKTEALKKIES